MVAAPAVRIAVIELLLWFIGMERNNLRQRALEAVEDMREAAA